MKFPVDYGYVVEAKGVTPPLFKQVHGTALLDIEDEAHARHHERNLLDADGAFTAAAKLTIPVFTADCVPLLFFGLESTAAIAAVHAGWRGALGGIAALTAKVIGPRTKTMHVAVGPAILKCCFEVQDDFIAAFRAAKRNIDPYLEKSDGRWRCDLVRFLRYEELSSIPDDRFLTDALRCTVCSLPRLPSYRRDRGTDPRIRSWIRKRAAYES